MRVPSALSLEQLRGRARKLTNYFLAVSGGVLTIISFVAIITSKTLQNWVSNHPYPIFIALVIAVLTITIVVNYWLNLYSRYTEISSLVTSKSSQPTDNDRRLIQDIYTTMPPTSNCIKWLKQEFDATALPAEPFKTMHEAMKRLDLSPIGFDNKVAHKNYLLWKAAFDDFDQKVQRWAIMDERDEWLSVPAEWEFEQRAKYITAATEIQQARDALVKSYGEFLNACHEHAIEPIIAL